ncbi:uncharacterized protein LOC142491021 [Ascaphus truei]|uniref:uncharacterized protein LOC142491021 n=1 Tax=Ascaphus truei TaxID=8439 RepID=UPI003F5A869C
MLEEPQQLQCVEEPQHEYAESLRELDVPDLDDTTPQVFGEGYNRELDITDPEIEDEVSEPLQPGQGDNMCAAELASLKSAEQLFFRIQQAVAANQQQTNRTICEELLNMRGIFNQQLDTLKAISNSLTIIAQCMAMQMPQPMKMPQPQPMQMLQPMQMPHAMFEPLAQALGLAHPMQVPYLHEMGMPQQPYVHAEAAPMPQQPYVHAEAAPMPQQPYVHAKAAPMPQQPYVHAEAAPMPQQPYVHAEAAPMPQQPYVQAEAAPMPQQPYVHGEAQPTSQTTAEAPQMAGLAEIGDTQSPSTPTPDNATRPRRSTRCSTKKLNKK